MTPILAILLGLAAVVAAPASAQQRPAQTPAAPQAVRAPQNAPSASGGQTGQSPGQPNRPSALGNLSNTNKEPIKIDADRLDVFDKEQRAVFAGNVVAVQGESTIKCTELAVLYEQRRGAPRGAPAPAAAPGQGEGAIRRIDCKGPVTIVSRTQTATGDKAVFDRSENRIELTGNVALSDGPNVTQGDKIVYDLNSGVANIESNKRPGSRVRALFVPGSNSELGQAGGSSGTDKPQARRPATN